MDAVATLWFLTALLIFSPSARQAAAPPHQLPINHLRPAFGSAGAGSDGLQSLRQRGVASCDSWRFGVETNNLRDWTTVPAKCEKYIGHYLLGQHYRRDSAVICGAAAAYAEGLKLGGDGKDVWIFDIDETSLSNLPYYAMHGFGVEVYNDTTFNKWVNKGIAPALPESLKLYNKLLSLGLKVVFLTGRREVQRQITARNLKRAGYSAWEKLLLKGVNVTGTALAYKSAERKKLEKAGYRLVGNIGDQWSDILGIPEGARTFKLPDPIYYIP